MRQRRSSRTPLLRGSGPLAKVPPAVAFLVVLVVFGLGIWLRGPLGAGLLGLLGLGVLGLLAGAWAVLRPADRVLRVLVVIILFGVAFGVLHR
jgi:hypothetical protein